MPTPLCRSIGIEMPIIAFSHCRDVVAAVSRAGGLGVLGAGSMTDEDLDHDLTWLDAELAGRPYGVDLMFPATTKGDSVQELDAQIPDGHRAFATSLAEELGIPPRRSEPGTSHIGGMPMGLDHLMTRANAYALWEAARGHRITLLASALGPPPAAVREEAGSLGMTVAGLVGDPRHVKHQLAAGVDVLIAQGHEAAGHTGSITTMVLVPQVVEAAGDVPVVAAGGIATGRQVVAALALGAQAAWTGSVWLATSESDVHPTVKDKLVRASANDTQKTRSYTGKPSRQLKTSWTEAWLRQDAPEPLGSPTQQLLTRDAIVSAFEHEIEHVMGEPTGQAISLVTAQRSVASVMDMFRTQMAEGIDAIASLGD